MKKGDILVSGVQPTGKLHIGNYLGALKNFVDLQNSGKYQCYFFIADLHSLTGEFNPKEKQKQILNLTADFLAAGLDPKKSVIFQQSQIPAHSELMWILNTITPMGELERMTQFKEKAGMGDYLLYFKQLSENINVERPEEEKAWEEYEKIKNFEKYYKELFSREIEPTEKDLVDLHKILNLLKNLSSTYKQLREFSRATNNLLDEYVKRSKTKFGLFDYPVLMAADIIIYNARFVPVGDDQLQHLELTRTVVRKFNSKFGKTFIEPKAIQTETPRVMSLANPEKKMSKSQPESCLFIDDSPEEIKNKIKRAVTDSGSEIKYDKKNKPAISNLLEIYSALSGDVIVKLEDEFSGKNYSVLKNDLAELVADYFSDFRKKKSALLKNPVKLRLALESGSEKASKIANKKILEVKKKVGLI